MSECNKSFAQQFQDLLERGDEKVRVSIIDPSSAFLRDKLVGASGVILYESENGVSGHEYIASLDLDYLDRRYLLPIEQQEIINLNLGDGVHNGNVRKDLLNGMACLNYPGNKVAQSSWSAMVAQDYVSGTTDLHIRWASRDAVSGIGIFGVEYSSLSVGESISSYIFQGNVSGLHDGNLKMNEIKLNIPIGTLNENDQFFIRITRFGNIQEDTIGDISLFGASIKYRRFIV